MKYLTKSGLMRAAGTLAPNPKSRLNNVVPRKSSIKQMR